ncbi:diguanylate cyclase [Bacillus sp. T3]|uniref:sensor domain-containing diguanylate cyclase n=1 Tax=Bacillus sp. T3 TaxID=467262 RepID=UPI002982A5B6|nr:diguanylate cyclase [Bacillus sp. T3]
MKTCSYFKYFILLFSIFAIGSFIFFQQRCYASTNTKTIILPKSFSEMDVTNELTILVDQTSKISKSEILVQDKQFVPIEDAKVSGDLSKATYWIKLVIQNPSAEKKNIVLELKKPHLSAVSLYTQKNGNLKLIENMGYAFPFHVRTIKHRNMVFTLPLPTHSTKTYFIKINTDSFFQAPVTLWDPIAFSMNNYLSQTVFGLYYGIMLAMLVYNGFLFFSLKEKTYFYYIMFLLGFMLVQLIWDGFAFQWLWGAFPWWALRSNAFFILFTAIFSLLFTSHFLQLDVHIPILHKVVKKLSFVFSLFLLAPFVLSVKVATLLSMAAVAAVTLLVISIIVVLRFSTREAKYYMIAWVPLIVGITLNLLAGYKVIPLTAISLYAPKIGAVIEVMLLSLGLADKIKRVTIEKEILKKLAMFDPLTKLFNRGMFFNKANELYKLSGKQKNPDSLLLIDVDYFKTINDQFGHLVGDQALVFLGKQLQYMFNQYGIVGRYGGEEFIAYLPNTSEQEADKVAKSFIQLCHKQPFLLDNGQTLTITVSIGICCNNQAQNSLQEMVHFADVALYEAKNNGRDQVILASQLGKIKKTPVML